MKKLFSTTIKNLLSLKLLIAMAIIVSSTIVLPTKLLSIHVRYSTRAYNPQQEQAEYNSQIRILDELKKLQLTENNYERIFDLFFQHVRLCNVDVVDRYFAIEVLPKLLDRRSQINNSKILKLIQQVADDINDYLIKKAFSEKNIDDTDIKVRNIINIFMRHVSQCEGDLHNRYFAKDGLKKILELIPQIDDLETLELIENAINKLNDYLVEKNIDNEIVLNALNVVEIRKNDLQPTIALREIFNDPNGTTKTFIIFNQDNNKQQLKYIKKAINNPTTFVETINAIRDEISSAVTIITKENLIATIDKILPLITSESIFGTRTLHKCISNTGIFDLEYFTRLQVIINLLDTLIEISNKWNSECSPRLESEVVEEIEVKMFQGQIQILQDAVKIELKKLPRRIKQLSKKYIPTNFLSKGLRSIVKLIDTSFAKIGIEESEIINLLEINEIFSNFIVSLNELENFKVKSDLLPIELMQKIVLAAKNSYYDPMNITFSNCEEFTTEYNKITEVLRTLSEEETD